MKHIFKLFFWVVLSIALSGCIKDFTPKESVVELKAGQSQTFKAVSDDPRAKLVWTLDGKKVAYNTNQYKYTAETITGDKPVKHTLIVREEGGRYVRYYELAGAPGNFASSVQWIIKVLPQINPAACYLDEDDDGFGDINKMVQSQNPPDNCIADKTDCNDDDEAVYPGAAETCGDSIDQDCNGKDLACPATDNDHDGSPAGIDCNDNDAGIHPGATEVCGDGIDQDCNGSDQVCPPDPNDVDNDGDGFTENQGDCNDVVAAIHPGATEACNNVDDNCNSQIDDGIASMATTCGVGACAGNAGTSSCVNGAMVNSCDPLAGATAEVCDGVDNDCDGTADDAIACNCVNGETRQVACGVGACAAAGIETCANGAWNANTCVAGSPVAEVCDGIDNNCDGNVDNGIDAQATTCGVGACASTGALACVSGALVDSCQPGTSVAEICDGLDNNCNGQTDDGIAPAATTCGVGACAGNTGTSTCVGGAMVNSCDPLAGATAEVCDGADNDCDGTADDAIACGCINGESRQVACGVGACAAVGAETCVNGEWTGSTCEPGIPVAEVCDGIDNNCDGNVDNGIDAQATTCGVGQCAGTGALTCVGGALVDSCKPGTSVAEICDGLDNNCNGQTDDGMAPVATACGVGACAGNTGTSTCVGGAMVDSCNPLGGATTEVCDAVDNDCDGSTDDGLSCTCTNGAVREVACGVGACADTGSETCVNGQWAGSTCTPGTPVMEVCDNIDNDCDGNVDNGIASQATTCGVGACVRTGTSACVGGAMVDSCQAGTPVAEICDGLDNNCNGTADDGVQTTFYRDVDNDTYGNAGITTQACAAPAGYVANSTDCNDNSAAIHPGATEICNAIDDNCNGPIDDGIAAVPTTCGVGACANNTGSSTCVGGAMVDSCNPLAGATAEVCDNADNNCDGSVDNGIAPIATTCGIGACVRTGQSTCGGGALIDSCQPGTPTAEDCGNGIDDNCDGSTDAADTACQATTPAVPANVAATDRASGLTDVVVTWSASQGATYYNVYRAIWEANSEYELVGSHVTETSFTFVQNWSDVYAAIGDTPAMLPTADCAARTVFANNLNAYRANALHSLLDFKAPAFFTVEACNDQGCSDPSAADAGQAEFIHTAAFSEVAQLVIPSWGYPTLIALSDSPPGADALSWTGIDICGAGGGMVMGRLDQAGLPMVDVYFENYEEAWDLHPNASFYAQGWLGGQQALAPALKGVINVSGQFDLNYGGANIHMFMYTHVGGTVDANMGYVTVTYNGAAYQFSLPVQPVAGQTYAAPPVPVTMNDVTYTVKTRVTTYPVPFAEGFVPDVETPMHCTPGDPAAVVCDRVSTPQPHRP